MENSFDIQPRGERLFRARIGPVSFDVELLRRSGGALYVHKATSVFVEPDVWKAICFDVLRRVEDAVA